MSAQRGVLMPAAATALVMALLVGLGLWQLDRKVWKETLVSAMNQRLAAAPADLPSPEAWSGLTPDNSEFRRVRFRADFLPVRDTYAYVAGSALRNDIKGPGYFVFRPARLDNGRIVVVNRGYVPIDHTEQSAAGPQEITGYLRFPEKGSSFTSASDAAGDTWFVRDQRAMAAKRGWGEVAPFYVDQETPMPASGLPRPSALTVNLRNDHFGYALTWFGLALTLAGVFTAWLIARWRQPAQA
jgi:cytochrome oxidase assembly protein ShyY1